MDKEEFEYKMKNRTQERFCVVLENGYGEIEADDYHFLPLEPDFVELSLDVDGFDVGFGKVKLSAIKEVN